MDYCERCKYAICSVIKGYSPKECGLQGGSMIEIEDCRKNSEAFFENGENCEYFKEIEPDYE